MAVGGERRRAERGGIDRRIDQPVTVEGQPITVGGTVERRWRGGDRPAGRGGKRTPLPTPPGEYPHRAVPTWQSCVPSWRKRRKQRSLILE